MTERKGAAVRRVGRGGGRSTWIASLVVATALIAAGALYYADSLRRAALRGLVGPAGAEPAWSLTAPEGGDVRLAFSAQGELLAAGVGGVARVWGLPSGRLVGDFHAAPAVDEDEDPLEATSAADGLRGGQFNVLAFTPDGGGLLAKLFFGPLTFWRVDARAPLWTHETRPGFVAARFSPDGARIILRRGRRGHLVDAATGAEIARFRLARRDGPIVSADPEAVAFGAETPTLSRFAWRDGAALEAQTLAAGGDPTASTTGGRRLAALSPAGERALLIAADGRLTLWAVDLDAPIAEIAAAEPTGFDAYETVAFSADGAWFWTRTRLAIQLFDARTGAPRGAVRLTPDLTLPDVASRMAVMGVAIAPGPRPWVALHGRERDEEDLLYDLHKAVLIDLETGRVVYLGAGDAPWDAVAFTADGATLALARGDGAVLVWRLASL